VTFLLPAAAETETTIYLISAGWEPGACGPVWSYCVVQTGPMWVQPGAGDLWHATKYTYLLIAFHGCSGSTRAFRVSFQLLTSAFSAPELQMGSSPAVPNSTVAIKTWFVCFFSLNNSKLRGFVESFASSLGFSIVVPKFNYYFLVNSIFLKRDFPFCIASGYKPVIRCKKYDLL